MAESTWSFSRCNVNFNININKLRLLALANGAGDVVTALVASGTSGGLSYNVGALYGAGLFVCSVVVALTIRNTTVEI